MSALALKQTEVATTVSELDKHEFMNFSHKQRVAKCRAMAAEAERLAVGKSMKFCASYLQLARKWTELADEMERVGER